MKKIPESYKKIMDIISIPLLGRINSVLVIGSQEKSKAFIKWLELNLKSRDNKPPTELSAKELKYQELRGKIIRGENIILTNLEALSEEAINFFISLLKGGEFLEREESLKEKWGLVKPSPFTRLIFLAEKDKFEKKQINERLVKAVPAAVFL